MYALPRKSLFMVICLSAAELSLASLPAHAQQAAPAAPSMAWVADDQSIVDAYVYLIGRALVIRQEHTDLAEEGIDYNLIKYNPLAAADFANPNFDVAYLEAWIAPDNDTPIILEVPKIEDRYYTAQILDEWGEVIVNINERTMPSNPYGKFAFVPPGSQAQIPDNAVRIELHSSKAKLLGRVELKTDSVKAKALQEQFKIEALGQPEITPPVEVPTITNEDLVSVALFDNADPILNSAPDVMPIAAELQVKTRAIAKLAQTPEGRERVQKLIDEQAIPRLKAYVATDGGVVKNNWITSTGVGNYGKDFWLRSGVNYIGIWANVNAEAQYFSGTLDASGKPLSGSNSYEIHFPASGLPSEVVNGYWSVSMLSLPDYRAVPNDLKRYSLNPYSGLKFESDGSLKVYLSAKLMQGMEESNWLPAPADKPFALNFRTYVPKEQVTTGQWFPPAIEAFEVAN